MNEWSVELEEIVPFFNRQAVQIANYDKKLVENSDKIFDLDHKVREVVAAQDRLEHSLDTISYEQAQLHHDLKRIEEDILKISPEPVTNAEIDRDKGYKLAEEVNSNLDRMTTSLKEIIAKVNASQTSATDKDNPAQQVLKILNTHMNSLDWVDKQIGMLNQKVKELKTVQGEQEAQQTRLMGNGRLRLYDSYMDS